MPPSYSASAYYSNPRSASPPVFTPPLEFAVPSYVSRDYDLDPSSVCLPLFLCLFPVLISCQHYTRLYSHRSHPPHLPVPSHFYPTSPRSSATHSSPVSPPYTSTLTDSPPLLSSSLNFHPADQKEPLHQPPSLKPGDVIFWHHLARKGEVPGVIDDLRARHPAAARASRDILFNR